MKKIILFTLFPINFLFAFEVTCNFEEVYQNNEVQQGVFLIKDKNLRYQYYNQDLFTIIVKNDKYFLINNRSKVVQNLKEKSDTIDQLIEIVSDFPNINNTYKNDRVIINIEKSSNKFIKRVSIQSEELNLSINVMNCKFNEINKKYFKHFNFEEYSG